MRVVGARCHVQLKRNHHCVIYLINLGIIPTLWCFTSELEPLTQSHLQQFQQFRRFIAEAYGLHETKFTNLRLIDIIGGESTAALPQGGRRYQMQTTETHEPNKRQSENGIVYRTTCQNPGCGPYFRSPHYSGERRTAQWDDAMSTMPSRGRYVEVTRTYRTQTVLGQVDI